MREEGEGRTGRAAPSEELAKQWLTRVMERTPLGEVEGLPASWFAHEAPRLIADVLHVLGEGMVSPVVPTAVPAAERAGELARLRGGERASAEVPRDLAALQAVIVAALERQSSQPSGFGPSIQRLTELFGELQASVTDALVRERAGEARRDPLTGLPRSDELREWMEVLAAGAQRYGQPFSLLAIDLDGLKRINDAYGREAGDTMLVAVADLIGAEIRASDRLFRGGDDEFCLLATGQRAGDARPLGERLLRLVADSQLGVRPRVAIAVGLASCPEHGHDPDRLLEAAEEATYAAKAAGSGVELAPSGDGSAQDG